MSIDFLLINSPRELSPSKNSLFDDKRMPLGIMYISAYLKSQGVKSMVLDAECLNLGLSDIMNVVNKVSPQIIGLNCHTLNRFVVYEIVKTIKFLCNNIVVILGGSHPSLAPKDTLAECPDIDIIVIGEGEITSFEIFNNIRHYFQIPGIAYVKDGKYSENQQRGRIFDLDKLPFPDLSDIPINKYFEYKDKSLPGLWNRAYLTASRGCLYQCSFCPENPLWGGVVTFRSADSVIEEMCYYFQEFSISRFYFYDDTFTSWPSFQDFCEKCSKFPFNWSCSTRIDDVNEMLIQLMRKGGCLEIAFGLESGSLVTLKKIRKGWQNTLSKEDVAIMIQTCLKNGIIPRTHFMIGFPWEIRNDISETVKFAIYLKKYSLTDANFFPVKINPGTLLFRSLNTFSSKKSISGYNPIYDSFIIIDWYNIKNNKVSAKLKRFNDIPVLSANRHINSLELRKLINNAYEIFFNNYPEKEVDELLWKGVDWQE